jgi:hypothetical protein
VLDKFSKYSNISTKTLDKEEIGRKRIGEKLQSIGDEGVDNFGITWELVLASVNL